LALKEMMKIWAGILIGLREFAIIELLTHNREVCLFQLEKRNTAPKNAAVRNRMHQESYISYTVKVLMGQP
jgi:hypothetical protein